MKTCQIANLNFRAKSQAFFKNIADFDKKLRKNREKCFRFPEFFETYFCHKNENYLGIFSLSVPFIFRS